MKTKTMIHTKALHNGLVVLETAHKRKKDKPEAIPSNGNRSKGLGSLELPSWRLSGLPRFRIPERS